MLFTFLWEETSRVAEPVLRVGPGDVLDSSADYLIAHHQ